MCVWAVGVAAPWCEVCVKKGFSSRSQSDNAQKTFLKTMKTRTHFSIRPINMQNNSTSNGQKIIKAHKAEHIRYAGIKNKQSGRKKKKCFQFILIS